MALPTDPQTLFGGGMLVVGCLVVLVSLRYVWRTTRVLRAPALTSLHDVETGTTVRVDGTVASRDGRSLEAPFSGRRCIALRASVEERRLGPLVVLPWSVTVWEAERAVPFQVRTTEDEIPVSSSVRSVVLATDDETRVPSGEEPPDRIATYEANTGRLPRWTFWRDPPDVLRPIWRRLGFGRRRYTESALEAGDEVTVVGERTRDGGVDPLVLSDRSPRRTFSRMARTSLAGLTIGAVGLVMGGVLLLV